MSTRLLEVQPKELKFIVELKKQSSCSVQISNNTHHHVAFKVKTTSPKKYCVRPNVGIVMPKSTCEFTVTMQAPRSSALEMESKDKFLIQSTVVTAETADDDITSSMFSKDAGKYVEESKLRVILISPPNSPILSPINGALKEALVRGGSKIKDQSSEFKERLLCGDSKIKDRPGVFVEGLLRGDSKVEDQNRALKEELVHGNSELKKDHTLKRVDSFSPERMIMKDVMESIEVNVEDSKPEKFEDPNKAEEPESKAFPRDVEESKEANGEESIPIRITEFKLTEQLGQKRELDLEESKLVKDVEGMKSKLSELELKLGEAQSTISKLTEERRISAQEIKFLQDRFVESSSSRGIKNVQAGFPLLFVCMVALCSTFLGYLLHR